jgi:hypothetical protein
LPQLSICSPQVASGQPVDWHAGGGQAPQSASQLPQSSPVPHKPLPQKETHWPGEPAALQVVPSSQHGQSPMQVPQSSPAEQMRSPQVADESALQQVAQSVDGPSGSYPPGQPAVWLQYSPPIAPQV